MVGQHHRLNGHEFEQAPGNGKGQGSLVCCSPWGLNESDVTEQLNDHHLCVCVCTRECVQRQKERCKNLKDIYQNVYGDSQL